MPIGSLHEFETQRPRLQRLAYQILGTRSDADDILQEAYLRWRDVDLSKVQSPASYLSSIVVRLCIDRRRDIDRRKETYIGTWLPEPAVERLIAQPDDSLERAESISFALLYVLETLGPYERAAYLLRRMFDYEYSEIANILDKDEAYCRQLVSRAEGHLRAGRPRFDAHSAESQKIVEGFLRATETGNVDELAQLLAEDVVIYSDGGGKVTAARVPIRGVDKSIRFLTGVRRKAPAEMTVEQVLVNGSPGFVTFIGGVPSSIFSFNIVDGQITECFIVRNPSKMHLASIGNIVSSED